jgi:tetratricopeptide (TPR) repeat protein
MKLGRLASAAAIALAALGARADDAELRAIWDDESFKKAFLGSYGVQADIEPPIGPQDRPVLEQVYPLLGSEPERAAEMLREAKTPESSAIFDFVLGNLAFQDDRMAEAETHYREAVVRFPSFRRAWRNLGLIHAREGRYDDAIASFTRMIELGGGDSISLGLLATAYLSKQDYLAAETAFRQALLLEPENAQWRIGLARSVVKQEKHEEAVALLGVLLERDPERSEFWLMQASALLGMKQPLRAAENLEMVALLGQGNVDSFVLLGDIYLNEGQIALATNAYLRGIDVDPAQPVAKPLRSAEQLSLRGAMAEARTVIERIREKLGEPSPDEALRMVKLEARIAAADGAGADAVRLLEEVVARDPFDGEALLLIGQHYADTGDRERAIIYLERAADIESYEAQAKLAHAKLLVAAEKYDEALPLLRRVQEIRPREQVARYLEQVERLARTQRSTSSSASASVSAP